MPKAPSERPESQVMPEPALEKRTRRRFTPDYKLRIITAADACKHGELGALLRREKLYSNLLSEWRHEYARHGIEGLSKSCLSLGEPYTRFYHGSRKTNAAWVATTFCFEDEVSAVDIPCAPCC